jgi:hypothetical protein
VVSVVLRRKDGQEVKVELDSLSREDLRYARKQVPPEMDIRASIDTEDQYVGSANGDYQMQYQIVKPTVTVEKESLDPYGASLTMEVVLIGKILQNERLMILNSSSSTFSFTDENKERYEYTGNLIDLQFTSGGASLGLQYEGYLVAIRDYSESIIALEASSNELEDHAEDILEAKPGTQLSEDMRLLNPVQPRQGMFRRLLGRWF